MLMWLLPYVEEIKFLCEAATLILLLVELWVRFRRIRRGKSNDGGAPPGIKLMPKAAPIRIRTAGPRPKRPGTRWYIIF
jgi:hypothetical protein